MGPNKSSRALSQNSELWGHGTMSAFQSEVSSELMPLVQSQRVRSRKPGFLLDRLLLCEVRVLNIVDFSHCIQHSPLISSLGLEHGLVKPERLSQLNSRKDQDF